MSKRQIKAKRWLRKEMNREYADWEWSRSATGKLKALAYKPVISGDSFGPTLAFKVRYRKFGDGRVQLRDGFPDLRGGSKITWGEWYNC